MYTYQVYPLLKSEKMSHKSNEGCCDHGGKRHGCGRKPGIKTQPIRLPLCLLEQLSKQGEPRELIINACLAQYPSLSLKGLDKND